jgi:hypothetical protein
LYVRTITVIVGIWVVPSVVVSSGDLEKAINEIRHPEIRDVVWISIPSVHVSGTSYVIVELDAFMHWSPCEFGRHGVSCWI